LLALAVVDDDALAMVSPEGLARVAERALHEVRNGMTIGLGTGRAAEAFIRRLGEAVRGGLAVRGVPTSDRSDALARELGIGLATLDEVTELDVAFDGADEVMPDLSLTKGLGGALLRERVVASLAKRFVILVTEEKCVARLGERSPLPVEVVPFAVPPVERSITRMGLGPVRRTREGVEYRTDNGNAILDVAIPAEKTAYRDVDRAIRALPGVIDTGWFFDSASIVLVGEAAGVREMTR
jgi:ribose 5-phosphate isomerase A